MRRDDSATFRRAPPEAVQAADRRHLLHNCATAALSEVKASASILRDLRHTIVSLLMELGVPPHVVQAIARHADVKMTLKIYSHANLDAMRQALGKLDGRLS